MYAYYRFVLQDLDNLQFHTQYAHFHHHQKEIRNTTSVHVLFSIILRYALFRDFMQYFKGQAVQVYLKLEDMTDSVPKLPLEYTYYISNQLDVSFSKFFHFIFATLHVSGVPCPSSGVTKIK
jgi:hypothetical protein